jgi:hypothetical protein
MQRRSWLAVGFSVALAAAAAGCGGGAGGSCSPPVTAITCSPKSVKAGDHINVFGTNLPGKSSVVTFKDAEGVSEMGTTNLGDAESIDVTVPTGLMAGTLTLTLCGASCEVTLTP